MSEPRIFPGGIKDHGNLDGLSDDDHIQYTLADGTRDFTGVVIGVDPTLDQHLTTKNYVDTTIAAIDHGNLNGLADDDHPQYGHLSQNEVVVGRWTFTGSPEFYGAPIHDISFNGSAKVTFFTKVEHHDNVQLVAGNTHEVDGTMRIDGTLRCALLSEFTSDGDWLITNGTHTYGTTTNVQSRADYLYQSSTHTYGSDVNLQSEADWIIQSGTHTYGNTVDVQSRADYIFTTGTHTYGNTSHINSTASEIHSGIVDHTDGRWISPATSAGIGGPATPIEAEIRYNTADDRLYYYDNTRSRWLSIETVTIPFSRTVSGVGTVFLHTPSAQSSTTFGFHTGKAGRIVGASANINTSNSSTSIRLRQGASTTTHLTFSANTTASDHTLDVQVVAANKYGIDVSGGTNTINGFLFIKWEW